ncbi:hypothetical protein E3E14_21380 [Streptomyces sp. ICN441]|uniref:hypothetical protein n=1 Tax=Streptomyces sp. ICN441 TaxID=2558286 RepID=UPI001068F9B6|nr:hypothetical protein [Streptomyces sp. ICN441]TFE47354.1 hypothetical protein E3E14_21380 [Streptomyces sp. ICN441]
MEMSFRKLPDDQHEILVRARKGPDVRLPVQPVQPVQPVGPTMPNDLVHAVVETDLGIDDGFWGAMARGATFQGFELVTPGRHRRSGMKVLRRGGAAVMAAELSVNWAYRVWRGLSTEGRGVGRAPIDAEALARTGPRLNAAARWAALPEGGGLLWRWSSDRWASAQMSLDDGSRRCCADMNHPMPIGSPP